MRLPFCLPILAPLIPSVALGQGLVREIPVIGGPFGGSSVVSAGDIDGDGVEDLAIGGAGYINAAGGFVTVVSGATGENLYQPFLDPGSYSTGLTLANLGDVTGDGVPDLAAGDDVWGGGITRPGAVTITRGGDGALVRLLEGESPHDLFGWSLDRVPDVDGDGVLELVVGAPGCDGAASNAGAVYLYSGASQTLLWKRDGVEVDGAFGYTVRGIGDLDGDGRGDIVASGPGESSATGEHAAGRTLLLSGATGQPIRIVGVGNADDQSGRSLDVLGDLNGDLLPEIAVGSPFASENFTSAGRVEIVSSADGAVLHTIVGSEVGQQLGMHLAAAGDLDGDGVQDFAYSERGYGAGDGNTKWQILSGATNETIFTLFSVQFTADRRPAAAVGDLNGDGVEEFAVGNPSSRRVRIYERGGNITGRVCYPEPHSTSGFGASLEATSVSDFSTSQNDVRIEAQALPLSTGYFLVGTSVASTPMAGGGQGTLCLGQSEFGRFADQIFIYEPGVFGSFVALNLDNSAIPLNGGTVAAVPGDTFYFQYWFRDVLPSGAPTSNLSDAIGVTFQ